MTSMTPSNPEGRRIAVIGGGAAGLMAALTAAREGADVTLLERNDRVGKKLRITGKGRCNVTNDCDLNEFLTNVPTNPRFLYTALSRFSTQDTKAFFEAEGVALKTERGKRVFPQSDRAGDIVAALERACRRAGVEILHRRVRKLLCEDGCMTGVMIGDGETLAADAVILCTGGRSYPTTGSDGDGYRFATELGHTVTELHPSLVPIVAEGRLCASLQGLSLKNVSLCVVNTANGKAVYEDFGEMMFTHFGVTGPVILSASAHLRGVDISSLTLSIDLKPALDEKTLDTRLLSDFSQQKNKDFINSLGGLLPAKLIEPFVKSLGINPRKKVNVITKEERRLIVERLKCFEVPLYKFRPIEEAIITSGGIDVKQVNPKTMMSKITDGLYFAGEILDLDAYTGGFNLQIAFSTGYLAGKSSAEY